VPLSLRGFFVSVTVVTFVSVTLSVSLRAQTPGAPLLGRISFPTSGSARAQPAFIRGVLLLHSFEYDDAIEAFRQAQIADPGFAMAYWGEALSYNQPLWLNENLDKARATLARLGPTRAARQAKAPTAREQGYLDAVERLFGDGAKPVRDRAYADRMAQLHAQFPEDDEASTFYALALLSTIPPGARNLAVSLKAGEIALAVLKRNPEHPGANHYALHAFDDGEHAARALQAARTYARIAPASSHARHMPSHVFLPLGMWDDAVASDEAAFATSIEIAKRKGLPASQYDFHALSWLHYEYLQQGRFAKARETMRLVESALGSQGAQGAQGAQGSRGAQGAQGALGALGAQGAQGARGAQGAQGALGAQGAQGAQGARGVQGARGGKGANPGNPEHSANHANHVESEIGKGYDETSLKSELASMKARLVVESGDWAPMKGQGSFDNIDELFALGMASVPLRDPGRADAALEQLTNAAKTIPDQDASEVAAIMAAELEGLIKLGRGDKTGALAALARGAQLEAKRPRPIARPYPIKPAGELYGEILLGTGDAVAAVTQFKGALARTPGRAASLLGLARATSVTGPPADAVKAAKAFLAAWHLADKDRPELAEMQQIAR
jgi:tetratricopeptide (TPR) repeat protein